MAMAVQYRREYSEIKTDRYGPSSRPVAGFSAIFNEAKCADATRSAARFLCGTRKNVLQVNAKDLTLGLTHAADSFGLP